MDVQAAEWLKFAVRWMHLIAAVLWMGRLFYFINLKKNPAPSNSKEASLWVLHGEGFYEIRRRQEGFPATLPLLKFDILLTWLSGACLLSLVYYTGYAGYTGSSMPLAALGLALPAAATAWVAPGALVLSWFVYNAIWRVFDLRSFPAGAAATAALTGAMAALFCHLLAPQAALIHLGAMLGTWMTANAWLRVTPLQRRLLWACTQGQAMDAVLVKQARARSVQNTYFAFPVLLLMISGHAPFGAGAGTGAPAMVWPALLLIVIGMAGCAALCAKTPPRQAGALLLVLLGSAAMVALLRPGSVAPLSVLMPDAPPSFTSKVDFSQIQRVVLKRCATCHSAQPSDRQFGAAPAGISFDDPADIDRHAQRIHVRTVVAQSMPVHNITHMTLQERQLVNAWFKQRTSSQRPNPHPVEAPP